MLWEAHTRESVQDYARTVYPTSRHLSAVASLPDVCAVAQSERGTVPTNWADGDGKWPEASVFAIWWQRAEDHILKSWQMYVVQHPVLRLSLHIDDVRIDRESFGGHGC